MIEPPRLARLLVRLGLRGDAREVIAGDLDQDFADALEAGQSPAAARRRYWRQALASVFHVTTYRKDPPVDAPSFRRQLGSGLGLDLRGVRRVFTQSPGYAFVAVASLAIAIGASTAIVSIARQLLLVPIAAADPDALQLPFWTENSDAPVSISTISSTTSRDARGRSLRSNFTFDEYVAMRQSSGGALAGFNVLRQITVTADGRPPLAGAGLLAGGNFFAVVQPPLVAGRGLADADDQPGAPLAAVISDRAWAALFDRHASVVGSTINLNGVAATIVGVTAPEWRGLSPGGFGDAPDAIVALRQQPAVSPEWSEGESLEGTPYYWVRAIARLDANAGGEAGRRTAEDALAQVLTAAFRGRAQDGGLSADVAAVAEVVTLPGARGYDGLRQTTSQPVRVLLGVAGIVLLIACINVAGLMLARGVSRQKELIVRRALGASRGRIIRALLIESTCLSLAGGVAGVWLAFASAPALSALVRSGLGARAFTFSLDLRLLGLSAAIAVGAGILSGLLPAIRFSRGASAMLQARAGNTAPRLVAGRVILALQIAISLPLVAGAGLLLRTMANFARVDLGFDASQLVLFSVDPTRNGTTPERASTVYPQLLARIETLPGVRAATLVENALLSGFESDARITVGGRTAVMYMNSVAPHYFETMGARLIAGRALDERDTPDRGYPVVINEAAVRAFFPDRSPIGQRFRNGTRDIEVVGVMADTKYDSMRAAVPPTMLFSYQQRRVGAMVVVVRSDRPAAALRPDLEAALAAIDPELPMRGFKTQRQQIDELLGRERVFVRLLTLFGGFALLLASVGLHGVTSYAVTRRTSEIGIRLALGAQRGQVLWMVLRQVLVLAAAGLALGLPLAWLSSPLVGSYLFGLDARDAATLLTAAGVMVGVAMLAGWRPARRASRLEAVQALRAE